MQANNFQNIVYRMMSILSQTNIFNRDQVMDR